MQGHRPSGNDPQLPTGAGNEGGLVTLPKLKASRRQAAVSVPGLMSERMWSIVVDTLLISVEPNDNAPQAFFERVFIKRLTLNFNIVEV